MWFDKESSIVEPILELFHEWGKKVNPVKVVRCDNAGENKSLETRLKSNDWKIPATFEYTPRNTPQYNHLAELKIHLACNKGRSCMIRANVPMKYRFRCFVLFVEAAILLDRLVVVEIDGVTKTRIEHFGGELPKYAKLLRTTGKTGVVTIKTKNWAVVKDRAVLCMMAGCCPQLEGDCYKMYDPLRDVYYETRDVIWFS